MCKHESCAPRSTASYEKHGTTGISGSRSGNAIPVLVCHVARKSVVGQGVRRDA